MKSTTNKQMTIAEFIAKHGFTATCERATHNPNMENSQMMDHWQIVIHGHGRQMTLVFSMGSGHRGKQPKLDAVLDCIGSDASAMEMTAEDFQSEFGYADDARAARRVWNACRKQGETFVQRFGRETLTELQRCERL